MLLLWMMVVVAVMDGRDDGGGGARRRRRRQRRRGEMLMAGVAAFGSLDRRRSGRASRLNLGTTTTSPRTQTPHEAY